MTPGIVAFLAGFVVILAAYAILGPKDRQAPPSRRVSNTSAESADGAFGKYVRPVLGELAPSVPGLGTLSDDSRDKLTKLLVRSGNPWGLRPEEFRPTQLLFAIIGFVFGAMIGIIPGLPLPWYALGIVFALLGFFVPLSTYRTAQEKRAKEIRRQLPEALDLLVITMTSGMNFEPALANVHPRMPSGLLREEFVRISSELSAGRSLESSLMSFSRRASSDEAEAFAKSVAQAQRLGSDVSETLGAQADTARVNYEMVLDKKVAKLSQLIFAALAPTMLPALLIVFLAPSLGSLTGGFV